MSITSKFRPAYWASQIFSFAFGLIFVCMSIYVSIDNGKIDYQNGWFWLACIVTLVFILITIKFVFTELKQLTITNTGIYIKYLVGKRTSYYSFGEITKFTTKRITGEQGAGRTPGYRELEIEFTNDRLITFSEDQYANYEEIKQSIYLGRQSNL